MKAAASKTTANGTPGGNGHATPIRNRIKELRYVKAEDLLPNEANYRRHPAGQRAALCGILNEIGYADALIAYEHEGGLKLIDGHLRRDVTPGQEVPVLVLDVTADEAARLLIHLDPLAAMAEIDAEAMGALLDRIGDVNLDLAKTLAGLPKWEPPEPEEPPPDPEPQLDRAAELQAEWGTSLGQLWEIPGKAGVHRLLCGDSTKAEDVGRVMNGASGVLCFTSPPYAQQREYTNASDLSVATIVGIFAATAGSCDMWCVNLGIARQAGVVVRYWDDYIHAAEACGLGLLSWNIWNRPGNGYSVGNLTAMFPISHEWVFVFGREPEKLVPTVPNKHGGIVAGASNRAANGEIGPTKNLTVRQLRELGTVFECNTVSNNNDHPAKFPVELPLAYIQSFNRTTVYDPFLGSGTTMVAAEQLSRVCYGLEISPAYVAVCLQRMKDLGLEPMLATDERAAN